MGLKYNACFWHGAPLMSVFDNPNFDHHESLHHFHDSNTGLRGIIAIHSTALGPAAGGCRYWQYDSDEAAVTDALRLSKGMTYKNAVAGLPFGGGKAVILKDPKVDKSRALFNAFGKAVDSLGGRYVTAEDVGISVDDMRHVKEITPFVSGLPQAGDGAGGDPSPWTALGVFLGLKAAVSVQLGKDQLKGLRVGVQGVGNVGFHLCRFLSEAGAQLVVADVNEDNLRKVRQACSVDVVSPTDILAEQVDVLAPCALGGVFDDESIPKIHAKVIAGAANNQLKTPDHGLALSERDILYAPDYVVNAGGIISVAHEYFGNSSISKVQNAIEQIPDRLKGIFSQAERDGVPTNQVADDLARRIVTGQTETHPTGATTQPVLQKVSYT